MKVVAIPECALLLALALMPTPLNADATAEARKQIQAAYGRENAATARKDTSGVVANMSPDYVTSDVRGQTATVELIRQTLPKIFASTLSLKAKTVITKFALKGNEADVTVKEHADITLFNQKTGKSSRLVVDETAQTTWVKTASGWKKKRNRTLSSHQTLDGKVVPS